MLEKLRIKTYQSLRWSERFFKTDMVYLAKGGFWVTGGQIVSTLLAFLASVAFANFLSRETYGTYKYILSIAGLFSVFTLSGMGASVLQSVAKGYEGSIWPALRSKLRWGLLASLAGIGMAAYYYWRGNHTLGAIFVIIGLLMPIYDSFSLYGSFLGGKKQFKLGTIFDIILQIIAYTAIIATIVLNDNIIILVLIYFLIYSLLRFSFFFITIYRIKPNSQVDPGTVNFGKHLSLAGIVGIIAWQIDSLLIFHYLGAANLAIYALSIGIPEQIRGNMKNLFNLVIPKYSELSGEKIRESIAAKAKKLTFFIAIIVTGYIILSPLVFKYIFPKYYDVVHYSQIYSLSLLVIPLLTLYSIYFSVQKKTRILYYSTVWGNLATIILTVVLIKFFGLWGAIVKNALAWAVMLGINTYYYYKN